MLDAPDFQHVAESRQEAKAMVITCSTIDDLSCAPPGASLGTSWQLFTDQVMGGLSRGTMTREVIVGRPAIRMRGEISLSNNGGFVQISLDLSADGKTIDATGWRGVELDVLGRDQEYGLHLRTAGLTRPWQSYRQNFTAEPHWRTIRLRFEKFTPHRTEVPFDVQRLRRLGLVAIGREFLADLALSGVRFF